MMDYRYFSGGPENGDSHVLTVSHNSTTPGINLERAIYVGIEGSSKSMAISIGDAEELRGALKDLIDEATHRFTYVVDTTYGAFSTKATSKSEARANAQKWIDSYNAGGSVGRRVWKVQG